jgi:hypothetical protein
MRDTWVSFSGPSLQVYINGHSWWARKMDCHGTGYCHLDNAFTHVEDLPRAQRFARRLAHKNWPRVLESFARKVNPLLTTILSGDRDSYTSTTPKLLTGCGSTTLGNSRSQAKRSYGPDCCFSSFNRSTAAWTNRSPQPGSSGQLVGS